MQVGQVVNSHLEPLSQHMMAAEVQVMLELADLVEVIIITLLMVDQVMVVVLSWG